MQRPFCCVAGENFLKLLIYSGEICYNTIKDVMPDSFSGTSERRICLDYTGMVKIMRLKRMIAVLCSGAVMALLMSGCGGADNSDKDENKMNTVIANKSNVKTLGRTYLQDDTLWLALSGTGIDFNYTGKNLKITVQGDEVSQTSGNDDNYARVAVYVDGSRVIDDMVNESEKTYDVFSSDENKTVSVQVVKLSECAMSSVGIKPIEIADGEKIEPAAAKEHRIEFIGDSITCGYGVDDEDENHHFSTSTEDVTKAYAYKTAQLLNADYSMFSTSGYGVISGYTDNGEKKPEQAIPQYYESLGFSYGSFGGNKPQSLSWDFNEFKPEAVVINLGTNDDSYCQSDSDKQNEFIQAYVEFLKKVRENNPDAHIFCTVGIMGGRIYSSVEEAYIIYMRETGDENISVMRFDQQNGAEDGLAADWHPTEKTHQKAADALSAEIKAVMGW